MLIIGTS